MYIELFVKFAKVIIKTTDYDKVVFIQDMLMTLLSLYAKLQCA